MVDQANTDARVQALQINSSLEDAGVLEKLPTSASSSDDAVPEETSASLTSERSQSAPTPDKKNRKGKKAKGRR
eukprot:3642815-Pyramimonas_sp.AAC.1